MINCNLEGKTYYHFQYQCLLNYLQRHPYYNLYIKVWDWERYLFYVKIVQVHLLKFLNLHLQKKLLNPQYCGQRQLPLHNTMQCYHLKLYINGYTTKDNKKIIILQCIFNLSSFLSYTS